MIRSRQRRAAARHALAPSQVILAMERRKLRDLNTRRQRRRGRQPHAGSSSTRAAPPRTVPFYRRHQAARSPARCEPSRAAVKLEVKAEPEHAEETPIKPEQASIKPEPASIKPEAALIKLEPSTAKTATASKKRARLATAVGPSVKRTLPQARPTEQECRAVHRALAILHPEVMERVRSVRSGERGPGGGSCGRRACVLDSLVGTILSQNTTDTNSHRAFSRLKEALPSWEEVRRVVRPPPPCCLLTLPHLTVPHLTLPQAPHPSLSPSPTLSPKPAPWP